uniref:Calponin-homology (CH) domain-containing protein n=1 Tax=Neogobius melanostomus TaxID=47308 RepID=A0A8C6UE94_9GOBI
MSGAVLQTVINIYIYVFIYIYIRFILFFSLLLSDSFPGSVGASDVSSSEQMSSSNSATLTNCGVPEFLTSNSELGLFYQSVLVAVERWFSLFGWANGPYPISVPQTLRRSVCVLYYILVMYLLLYYCFMQMNMVHRSVVDILIHLTGIEVPGVPYSQSISDDLNQRTSQLIQLYKAILDFLSVQGAHLCHIKPEYLLDKNEFQHWCSLQVQHKPRFTKISIDYESMSKRSWTDLLLQIYRAFILCRVLGNDSPCNASQTNADKVIPTCLQPLTSNIYSPSELQLLSWLNMHYESMRNTVWTSDEAPPARWIVNFDLDLADGLVLAALLAAYCPYLICSHFQSMYTKPRCLEEILHNNIIVVQALSILAVNMDIYVSIGTM